jgi:hypothetical protein
MMASRGGPVETLPPQKLLAVRTPHVVGTGGDGSQTFPPGGGI